MKKSVLRTTAVVLSSGGSTPLNARDHASHCRPRTVVVIDPVILNLEREIPIVAFDLKKLKPEV